MRIESVERASTVVVWVVIGLAMTGFSGIYLWRGARTLRSDLVGIVSALYSALPLVVIFGLGVLILAACAWTVFDRARNKLWLDIEAPVLRGGKLHAVVTSDRPLARQEGLQLEAELSCRRRELRQVEKIIAGETKQETEVSELPVWSTKQAVPLESGASSCTFEFAIPADALPTDQAAAGLFSAHPGIFWALTVNLPGANAPLRSYRIPVEPNPAV